MHELHFFPVKMMQINRLHTALFWVLLLLNSFDSSNCSVRRVKWRPVVVSQTALQNTSATKEELSVDSEIVCSLRATRIKWPKLYCYKDNLCQLSDLMAVPSENDALATEPTVDCMTNLEGCLYNGILYAIGDRIDPGCMKCFAGGMVRNVEAAPPTQSYASCEPPFTATTAGCLWQSTTGFTYCDGVFHCHAQGAKVASLENIKTKAQLVALDPEFRMNGLYIGARLIGNNYYYIESNNILADDLDVWKVSPTNSATIKTRECLFIFSYGYVGLYSLHCTEQRSITCERKLV